MGAGKEAQNVTRSLSPTEAMIQARGQAAGDSTVNEAMQGYSSGQMSLQDALGMAKGMTVDTSQQDSRIAEIQKKLGGMGRTNEAGLGAAIGSATPLGAGLGAIGGLFFGGESEEEKSLKQELETLQRNKEAIQGSLAAKQGALGDMIATDALTGRRFASDQIRQDPVSGQIYGDDGMFGRLGEEEKRLSEQGFRITPEDREAYGEASGDIARMFGQEEQNLAQMLQSRGLSSSNAATSGFTGLQGSKNERLSGAMRKIANDRMQNTMQRLQSTRSMIQGLGGNYENAIGNQFNRALAGRQQKQNELAQAAGQSFDQKQAEQKQLNTGFAQQEATKGPGLGDILGAAGSIGLGSLTGGAGTAAGKALGKAVGSKLGG